jgi:hypothetical protein
MSYDDVNFQGPDGRDTPRMGERWVFGWQTRAVQRINYIVYKVNRKTIVVQKEGIRRWQQFVVWGETRIAKFNK